MCDYSLAEIKNRLALEGEELAVHRFRTNTVGLASPVELTCSTSPGLSEGFWVFAKHCVERFFGDSIGVCAVCVPPGASLILNGIPAELQEQWKVQAVEHVKFVQTSMRVNSHRDAVRFESGLEISLQALPLGMRVRVVSLDSSEIDSNSPATTAEALSRV